MTAKASPFVLLQSGIPLSLLLDLLCGPHSEDLLLHELNGQAPAGRRCRRVAADRPLPRCSPPVCRYQIRPARGGLALPMGRSLETGAEWQAELRARGYRLTPQRQLVLEAVGQLGHATPEEIVTAVHRTASGVNISTVYRNLELLEELGLIQHTHLGHGASTYSVASDHDHVHLVCRDCGRVEEATVDLVAGVVTRLADERGFTVDVGHFSLFGQCGPCAEALAPLP